jgi:DNA-binding XRE family transcriptional regulator
VEVQQTEYSKEEAIICLTCTLPECNPYRRCARYERLKRKGGEKRVRKGLKMLRIKHDLRQEDMAKKCGTSLSTYNLIEQGKRQGSEEFWLALQENFELDGDTAWKIKHNQDVQI